MKVYGDALIVILPSAPGDQDMVDHTNSIARESRGCEGLQFEKGSIAGWSRQQGVGAKRRPPLDVSDEVQEDETWWSGADEVSKVDILIALHACDTATDDALFYGINARADVIVTSPCCHKEVRRFERAPRLLSPS